jgi:predicted AAA+ superfamily ATPase
LEYLSQREKALKPYGDIWETIHQGAYPELYDIHRDWADFYSSYVMTYLNSDINEIIHLKDNLAFLRFMTAAAARVGELLNYANLADEAGVSQPTVKEWLGVLEKTGIIYLLQPYSASPLNRAIKTPKLYFRDTGLASYLTRWLTSETLKNGAMNAHMFENFVINEIVKSYSNEGMDYSFSLFFYRGKDKKEDKENEVDFIIRENGILYPVEIKMTANPKAEMASAFTVLDKVKDAKRGMGCIVCQYPEKLYLRDNLLSLPVEFI